MYIKRIRKIIKLLRLPAAVMYDPINAAGRPCNGIVGPPTERWLAVRPRDYRRFSLPARFSAIAHLLRHVTYSRFEISGFGEKITKLSGRQAGSGGSRLLPVPPSARAVAIAIRMIDGSSAASNAETTTVSDDVTSMEHRGSRITDI